MMTKEELQRMKAAAQEQWKQFPKLGLAGESASDTIRFITEIEIRDKQIEALLEAVIHYAFRQSGGDCGPSKAQEALKKFSE